MRALGTRAAGRTAGIAGLIAMGLAVSCDRGLAPFDPDEQPAAPDLTRIFPDQAATRAAAAADPQPRAAGGAAPVRGEIRVDAALADRVPEDALLFVIARTPGGGPPLAVKRVEAPTFPYRFVLSAEDRMIEARPFEGPFLLSAWIDTDGNVMSRGEGDLQGQAPGDYAPGDEGIEITIDEAL